MKNEFWSRVMFFLLYIKSVFDRMRIYLGLVKVKYGMVDYFDFKGLPMTGFINTRERLAASQEYDAFRPDDVIVCTYPKAGTHFTMEVIASIYREVGLIERSQDLTDVIALLDMALPLAIKIQRQGISGGGTSIMSDLDSTPSPRLIMTHLSFDYLPAKVREGKVKMVNCRRNPKDALCSMYPFLRKMTALLPEVTWNEFVHFFISGNVHYGSYFKHLRQWYHNRMMSNMLNLQFEDMKKDLEKNVRKIAEFLGHELTQEQVDRIVKANTFENIKKKKGKSHPIYRKGKTGGWKADITVEQNEMLDEWIEREMEGMEDIKLQYD